MRNPKFSLNIKIEKNEKIILNKNTDQIFKHSGESILIILKTVFSLLNFNIEKYTLECLIVDIKDKNLLITFKIVRQ